VEVNGQHHALASVPLYSFSSRMGGPHNGLGFLDMREICCTFQESNSRLSSEPSRYTDGHNQGH